LHAWIFDMSGPFDMLKNAGAISDIGKKVTDFVIWGRAALEAVLRNQHDLFALNQKIAADLAEIKHQMGLEQDGNIVRSADRKNDLNGFLDRRDGREAD